MSEDNKCKDLGHVFINNICKHCKLSVISWKWNGIKEYISEFVEKLDSLPISVYMDHANDAERACIDIYWIKKLKKEYEKKLK